MRTLRRHLSWIVGAWLVCQAGALTAAPLLLLAGESVHAEEMCTCPMTGPGAVCPMHRSHGDAPDTPDTHEAGRSENPDDCVLSSGSQPAIPTLASIISGIGLIPPAPATDITVVARELILQELSAVILRSDRPESPPPRPSHLTLDIA